MTTNKPEVSIIIVVHDDSENLVASVASATAQTLEDIEVIIVDDCSDDDSLEVAHRLASGDRRIRAYQTSVNSGGPGAPRNVGISHASADWLTFLDSDDVLEPRAVEQLLSAGRAGDADIVCGRTQRLHLVDGRTAWWRPKLYDGRRQVESIEEYVDLVTDTTATAKLYRRGFLREHDLSFLERVHYEDLVFSAQVFSAAERIAVIPDHVYTWKVYPAQVRKSITNRRDEEINLQHRLEAIERVFSVVESGPHAACLRGRYQLKFLQHDAWLYLKGLVGVPRDHAQRVLELLAPHLRRIPEDVYDDLALTARLLYGTALCGSVDGVRELVPSLDGLITLEGTIVDTDGATHWLPTAPLDAALVPGTLEERLLDITTDDVLKSTLPAIKYGHRVSGIELVAEDHATVRGFTADPLGRVAPRAEMLEANAVARIRETGRQFAFPVTLRATGDQRFEWEFPVDLPGGLPYVRPLRLDFRIEVRDGTAVNDSPVLYDSDSQSLRLRPGRGSLRSLLRQSFAFRRTRAGRLSLKIVQPSGFRGRLDRLVHRVAGLGRSR